MPRDESAPRNAADEPSFEEAIRKLEEVVRQLEEGQLGLSDSLARYEEGVRYLKRCHEALEQAERKIQLLTGVDAEGNPLVEPFDDDLMTLEQKQESRGHRRSRQTPPKRPRSTGKPAERGDGDIDNQRGLF